MKALLTASMVLLTIPLIMWFSGWHWVPSGASWWQHALLYVTLTGSSPWGGLFSVFMVLMTLYLLKPTLKKSFVLILLLLVTVSSGQLIKVAIKNTTQEPRPYVVWLEQNKDITTASFYEHSRKEREQLLKINVANDRNIPKWQLRHWQSETGYSFPSGHVLFAACWALVLVGLLWVKRHYISSILLVMWALAIEVSRMVLGMHWPIDIIVSVIISTVISILAVYLWRKWDMSVQTTQDNHHI